MEKRPAERPQGDDKPTPPKGGSRRLYTDPMLSFLANMGSAVRVSLTCLLVVFALGCSQESQSTDQGDREEQEAIARDIDDLLTAMGDLDKGTVEVASSLRDNTPDVSAMSSELGREIVAQVEKGRLMDQELIASFARYTDFEFGESEILDADSRTAFRKELNLLMAATSKYADSLHAIYLNIVVLREKYGLPSSGSYNQSHRLIDEWEEATLDLRQSYYRLLDYVEDVQADKLALSESKLVKLYDRVAVAEENFEKTLEALGAEQLLIVERGISGLKVIERSQSGDN